MTRKIEGMLLVVATLLSGTAAPGQEASPASVDATAVQSPTPEPLEFRTRHQIELAGERLSYTAIAGETFLRDENGAPEASIFSIAYHLDDGSEAARRPITFLFNGGPGSAAVWLHLGAFGPRRLVFDGDPPRPGAPPYRLQANPHTLLHVTDLVFIDPIGTGFSRALGERANRDFWGVDEDAESVARFIRAYLTHHRRWSSPRYIAGESYGTIRASVLVRELQLDPLDSVALNGVILISTAIDVRIFLSGQPSNDLAYVTNLPTYAATAHYHDQLGERPADLERFLAEARRFAATDYLVALFAGDSLAEKQRLQVAAELSRFTGLDPEYVLRSDLRVSTERFLKQLLRHRGLVIGRHDTRVVGEDADDAGEAVGFDPFLPAIAGPFVSAINQYLLDDLAADFGRPYDVFTMEANQAWRRPASGSHVFTGFLNTTSILAEAAAANPDFRIFAASGYHDLTTTFFGVEYTLDHSGIDKDRIVLRNYAGGHMMYLLDDSLASLVQDITQFIAGGRPVSGVVGVR